MSRRDSIADTLAAQGELRPNERRPALMVVRSCDLPTVEVRIPLARLEADVHRRRQRQASIVILLACLLCGAAVGAVEYLARVL